jgi:hypothetical protein
MPLSQPNTVLVNVIRFISFHVFVCFGNSCHYGHSIYMQPNEIVTFRLHLSLHAEVHLNDLQTLYPFMTRKETHNGDTRGK